MLVGLGRFSVLEDHDVYFYLSLRDSIFPKRSFVRLNMGELKVKAGQLSTCDDTVAMRIA